MFAVESDIKNMTVPINKTELFELFKVIGIVSIIFDDGVVPVRTIGLPVSILEIFLKLVKPVFKDKFCSNDITSFNVYINNNLYLFRYLN
ncbi:hypothetical protein CbC4_0977 [Clostridium botulinum BKT015925]|nr:hypothetical protein CbC4_0977 [Clostridium botulinum BKT015925]